MAMRRNGGSTRKPPDPSDSHAEIDDWTRRLMPDLQPFVERLDEIIRETLSGAEYAVKRKRAYYGLPEHGWVMEMVAYDASVNLVFFGGIDLDPPPPLGDTDRSRYIKLKALEEVEQPELRRWIEDAGQVDGWNVARPRR